MEGRVKKPPIDIDKEILSEDEKVVGAREKAEPGSLSYAGESNSGHSKRSGVPVGGWAPFIAFTALAIVVSLILVFTYSASKSSVKTEYSQMRGTINTMDSTLADVRTRFESNLAAQGAFLKSGDLGGYARLSDIPSLPNLSGYITQSSLNDILSSYAKKSDVNNLVAYNSSYATDAELSAAVVYLKGLIGTGGTTTIPSSFVNVGSVCGLLVGPGAQGSYTGQIDLTYSVKLATTLTESQSLFYASVIPLECATADATCITSVMTKYTPTFTLNTTDSFYYLTKVRVVVAAFAIPDTTSTWWIGLLGLHNFGTPSAIAIAKI